MERTAENNEAG